MYKSVHSSSLWYVGRFIHACMEVYTWIYIVVMMAV